MNAPDLQRRRLLTFFASQPLAHRALGLGTLGVVGHVAAQTATDTKHLICLHLRGGNDQSNTLAPTTGGDHLRYQAARPDLCLPASQLIPISPINSPGPGLGLHPRLAFLAQAFNAGHAAVLANVGTLVQPISQAQWNRGDPTVPVPHQLFSHSDQENEWQTGSTAAQLASGWAGRMADRLTDAAAGDSLSMCLNAGSANVMLTGQEVLPYRITPWGSAALRGLQGVGGSLAAGSALRTIVTQPRSGPMEAHLGQVMSRSIQWQSRVASAVQNTPVGTAFPDTPLGWQLRGVAGMMKAAGTLGQKRQVFFADLDNFDFHDNLLERQAERLQVLDDALRALVSFLQDAQLWSNTVVFTTSDFGRALQSNGKGADHGWGSHHFVLGGPVVGRTLHGQWPATGLGTPEDAGQGRLIPTTATDQYAATLARWFGIQNDADLRYVLPGVGRFDHPDLGFLRPPV